MKSKQSLGKRMRKISDSLGFRQVSEYQIRKQEFGKGAIGEIDYVWLKDVPLIGEIPVIGFEIESSWRTSKHLKGDIFNLLCLNSAVGVVLFLEEGFDTNELKTHMEAIKRYAEVFSTHSRILAWTEKDIEKLGRSVRTKKSH